MEHIIAHTGQYKCQRQGCKQKLKTYSDMDSHINKDHGNEASNDFKEDMQIFCQWRM